MTGEKSVAKNVKLCGDLLLLLLCRLLLLHLMLLLPLPVLFLLLLPLPLTLPLALSLPLFPRREKEMERKRRLPGKQKKRKNPFVALKMRQMKMDGPLYGVKSKTKCSLNRHFSIDLVKSTDYICAYKHSELEFFNQYFEVT